MVAASVSETSVSMCQTTRRNIHNTSIIINIVKVKLSRYRHVGHKGEKYSSYSFLTSALDGGERSASRTGRALLPEK
jgi:hypothetical protein